jgi:hypothetical protein
MPDGNVSVLFLFKPIRANCSDQWFYSYQVSASCIILLFNVTQRILQSSLVGLETDLMYARNCITMLQRCTSERNVAVRCLTLLRPLYTALQSVKDELHKDELPNRGCNQVLTNISVTIEELLLDPYSSLNSRASMES